MSIIIWVVYFLSHFVMIFTEESVHDERSVRVANSFSRSFKVISFIVTFTVFTIAAFVGFFDDEIKIVEIKGSSFKIAFFRRVFDYFTV